MVRRRAPHIAVGVAVAVIAAAITRAAYAGGGAADRAEAGRHFEIGVAEARAGAYREAVVEFARAYELSPNFAVLYNLGKAQSALGDAAAALATFERYLADGGDAVPRERRAKVTAEMTLLLGRTGSIVARATPATARLSLDGAALDRGAAEHALRVNVGAHRVAADLDGYVSAEQTITVAGGDIVNVALALAPIGPAAAPAVTAPPAPAVDLQPRSLSTTAPPASPAMTASAPLLPADRDAADRNPASTPGSTTRRIGYVVSAIGVAGLAAAGGLYGYAWSLGQDAVNKGCTQDPASCPGEGRNEWNSSQRDIRTARIIAAISGGLLTTGVVIVLVAPSAPSTPASIAWAGRW